MLPNHYEISTHILLMVHLYMRKLHEYVIRIYGEYLFVFISKFHNLVYCYAPLTNE